MKVGQRAALMDVNLVGKTGKTLAGVWSDKKVVKLVCWWVERKDVKLVVLLEWMSAGLMGDQSVETMVCYSVAWKDAQLVACSVQMSVVAMAYTLVV